ncbi:MAG TPA: ABC transporter ATP-binding protein [Ilumatobacteraceae bacterium]|nr:ABC transporter ATP-binding protein [Ilumatobacteraceae bacterium]
MAALLSVDLLSKRFGGLTVVDRLSFEVAEGDAVGIVGPNGAGKTTLLNLIAGDLRADSGTVSLDGVDVTRRPAHVRCHMGIGRTAQIPRPFEGLTVFENALVGSTFGSGRARRASTASSVEATAVGALERVGMLGRADTPAGALTLLERKRLELARALATEPRLLLLDEIAGGLTEAEVLQLVATIGDIRAAGVAVVWIEHIVHALLRVVDRMIAMDFGRKLIEGPPATVMASDEVRSLYLGEDIEVA